MYGEIYMSGTTRRRKETPSNEKESPEFAVTLLASIATIIYAMYDYISNTPVDSGLYLDIFKLIIVAFILVAGLLIYILIKGYSMEVRDIAQKEYLDKLASHVYLMNSLMFIMLLTFVISFIILLLLKIPITYPIFSLIILISVMVGFIFLWPLYRKNRLRSLAYLVFLSIVGFLYFISIFWFSPLIAYGSAIGQVTVNMEGVYYKNNTPIPVFIQLTGPNLGLRFFLYAERPDHTFELLDEMLLKPERNDELILNSESKFKATSGNHSNYMSGNYLNDGKYNVFISTTNLTSGHFELVWRRTRFNYEARGFYLLNNTDQP